MSGGDKFRSGDTVPPQMLGKDPSLDRALSKLNQGLEPGEDPLFAKPDWAERSGVDLSAASALTTQEMDPRELLAGEVAVGGDLTPPQRGPVEMPALYKKQLITVRTRTVTPEDVEIAHPHALDDAGIVEDGAEPTVAVPARGFPYKLAFPLAVALAALLLFLGMLVGRTTTPASGQPYVADPRGSADLPVAASVPAVTAQETPTPASSFSAAAESPSGPAAPPAHAPSATKTPSPIAPAAAPKPLPKPLPVPAPSSAAPAPKPLWLLQD